MSLKFRIACRCHAPCLVRPALLVGSMCVLAACGRIDEGEAVTSPEAPGRPAPQAAAPSAKPPEPPRARMPSAEALTDAAITNRIREALKADPAMSGADVSINTDKGVVVLSGIVKSHEQTGVASAHAQRQDGVLRVENHLRPEFS